MIWWENFTVFVLVLLQIFAVGDLPNWCTASKFCGLRFFVVKSMFFLAGFFCVVFYFSFGNWVVKLIPAIIKAVQYWLWLPEFLAAWNFGLCYHFWLPRMSKLQSVQHPLPCTDRQFHFVVYELYDQSRRYPAMKSVVVIGNHKAIVPCFELHESGNVVLFPCRLFEQCVQVRQ